MELKPASSYSFSGQTPIQISIEGWRSLLNNIEAEFQTSQIYSQILTNLKTTLEEAATTADAQIKALGPDKIKLNLKNLTRTLIPEKRVPEKEASSTNPTFSEPTNIDEPEKSIKKEQVANQPPTAKSTQNNQNQVQKQMSTNPTTTIEPETITESIPPSIDLDRIETPMPENSQNSSEELKQPKNQPKRKKKLTKAEQAALKAEERHTYLYQLGQQLKKARQMRCLSLKQINRQTFVPLHYLEAIEKGQTEQLPEDIYLRGFIFRIGNALGFDGASLAAAFPMNDPLQGIIPSWSQGNKNQGFYLNQVHLYLGYTTLMAGAVGGLTWMSQQPSPGANLIPDNQETPDSVAHSNRHLESTQTPGLKSTTGAIVVGSDMARPETMI